MSEYTVTFHDQEYDQQKNLWVDALEHDAKYRAMIFRQMNAESELAGKHAEERLRYLIARRARR
jgi:hypothetical protein